MSGSHVLQAGVEGAEMVEVTFPRRFVSFMRWLASRLPVLTPLHRSFRGEERLSA